MSAVRDPWALLGVPRTAGNEQIKAAYRGLAKAYHPDRNPGNDEAAARFQEIARAFEQIRDEEARGRWLAEHESPRVSLQEMMSRLKRPESGKQEPVAVKEIEIEFRDAFSGVTTELQLEVDEACGWCGGSGAAPGTPTPICDRCRGLGGHEVGSVVTPCAKCGARGFLVEVPCGRCQEGRVRAARPYVITVPAGVPDGHTIRLDAGEGRHALVKIKVLPSLVFKRPLHDQADLLINVPISFAEACFGAEVRIPTPEKVIALKIPPATQSGKAFRISGQGMPRLDGRTRGDLFARVQVQIPTELSGAQKKLIRQLAQTDTADLRSHLFRGG